MNMNFKSFDAFLDTTAAAFILIGIIATGTAIVGETMGGHETIKYQDSSLSAHDAAELYANTQAAAFRVRTSGKRHS